MQEISYDADVMTAYIADTGYKLLENQLSVYDIITSRIEGVERALFFHLSDGTGKTFIVNITLAKLRQMKHIALAVTSNGIAASLPNGGHTVYSCCKLPLDQ